ncbi:MAG: hypothetical protein ACI8Y4_005257 [Candidatus Poriferisodalaceae bacterium]|jgi:hypothetical protein
MSATGSVALRVQNLGLADQTLVLAHLVGSRSETSKVSPADVMALFAELALPAPAKIGNIFSSLTTKRLLAKGAGRGEYKVSPKGVAAVAALLNDLDLVALEAEGTRGIAPLLGHTAHSIVPVTLAPPALIGPLRKFLEQHPFDTNVFGMTRFPDAKAGAADPVGRALAIAGEVCAAHGLQLHLASDRAISDDLWTNVAAHMWASRYGIALFEDRVARGLNHNLLIEVGAMVMTGRRCALLKDGSIDKMPTDFVGMIYKSVDLDDEQTVADRISEWVENDLTLASR